MPAPVAPDAVLEGLDPEQREVALALTGPVCVLAGAGTGKTRAITHRLAYGVAAGVLQPSQVLALTFTARAAGEMRTRLAALGVGGLQARTFHSAALRQLQYFWPQAVGGSPPPLADHKAPLIAESAGKLRIKAERSAVRDLSAEVEWAKVNLLTPERYPAAAAKAGRSGAAGLDLTGVARLLQVYEDVKSDRGVIDFEDVLLIMVGVLTDHTRIAEQIRHQYRHFVVDEFQDVSRLQHALLSAWLGERDELCVVGDPSQTIYSFAGADPGYLLGFGQRHPGALELQLVRDYRSTPQVVALANSLLDAAPTAARTGRVELLAQRPPGPAPEITGYPDDATEASTVAARVAALRQAGTALSEMAILYRTNAQAAPLEAELAAAGLAYQVRGGERFFARAEVRRAVMLLRGAARAGGSGGLGVQTRDVLSSGGWSATAPTATGAVRDQWESLQALAALADEIEARSGAGAGPATLADLVAELQQRAASSHAPTTGGLTLSSLHAAKGLEWDVVFIVGLSDGLLPISFATTSPQIEEERRLLYVGVTRARERVLLSWAASRADGGRAGRGPSRFLAGLRATDRTGAAGLRSSERSARDSGARSTLFSHCRICAGTLTQTRHRQTGRCGGCPPDYDEALLESLRQWRTGRAHHDKVPAYVVFTDATLEAIAFAQPADRNALMRINGVGKAKLDKYGESVLDLVAANTAHGL